MLEEKSIVNLAVYNSGMKKSLLDKIYFMDKVDAEVFVDYGCADGTLINFLSSLFPEFTYIGFDISEEMVQLARKNNKTRENVFFSSNWVEVTDRVLNKRPKKAAVLLSSVIHEVYSYGTSGDVSTFWDRVFTDGFDYIVIRDMMPSTSIDRRSDINDVAKVFRTADVKSLSNFERVWGSVENNKNLIHFFLKYRYTDNWAREVKENYMPINREEFLSQLPENYEITFHEHFILPFLKTMVEKDFKVELKDNTHIKLIMKKV